MIVVAVNRELGAVEWKLNSSPVGVDVWDDAANDLVAPDVDCCAETSVLDKLQPILDDTEHNCDTFKSPKLDRRGSHIHLGAYAGSLYLARRILMLVDSR